MSNDEPAVSSGDFAALVAFVTEFGDGASNPAESVVQSMCRSCSGTTFWMQCSEEDGVAKRTCTECKCEAFIGDSEEHWDEADTGDGQCPCGKKVFELAIGYCRDKEGHVSWMIVGARCISCSTIGVYTDWSIDYQNSEQLLAQT